MKPQNDEVVRYYLDMLQMNNVIATYAVNKDEETLDYIIERLLRPMVDEYVEEDRLCAASNPKTPHSVLWMILDEGRREELELLAGNEGAPSDLLLCLSNFVCSPSTFRRIWRELEENPNTPPEAFEFPEDVPPLELDDEPVAFF